MKTLVAIPCMDMVQTRFMFCCLRLLHVGDVEFSMTESSLIYDSRNKLAKKAVDDGFDRVLWLDSDMVFEPDLMEQLSLRLDYGCDFVCGLYMTRREPIGPVIYKACGAKEENGNVTPFVEVYRDYPRDSLFQIAACGFGGVMMKTSLLKEVMDKYGLPFAPVLGFGEDLSFCCKATQVGAKLWCDSSVKMGHVGYKNYSESDYLR